MAAISFTTAASVSSPTNSVASATPVHSVATLPSPTISATAQSPITLAKSVPSHFSLKAVVVSTTTTTATAVQDNLNSSTSATGLTVVNQCIQEAWSGKNVYVLLSRIGPYKIFFADINKTAPNNELESEVINAYMSLLVKRFNTHSEVQAFQIDTFEMTKIWNGKRSKLKVDPTMYKYLIGIVNDHHHWTVVIMLPSQRRALFLDPMGEISSNLKRCQDVTRYQKLLDYKMCF
ncbi:uncharacterized protein LOC127650780 [Xyrauchen texanus]|uniref:uncharacterized protein LOC127650780 n=1 Tax=Xyrauchen texanus TaxID=154827 RepID=UPI002241B606|nr:uncharacterized protein LOC127650780 [Xyrauchen texanus]